MLGKILLTLDAMGLLFGAVAADYTHTHIFNPRWPPHAKFHCGQTITLSVILGLATLYYTWRSLPLPSTSPHNSNSSDKAQLVLATSLQQQRKHDALRTATFTGTIYWLAGLAAILYPGTEGIDPEFGPPGSFPQLPVFIAFVGLAAGGWWWESRLLSGAAAAAECLEPKRE
ncbi:hypothetical protein B0T17DRAFT_485940 [Bombardia bombarda]|uniref:Uncharacterized protein n=1 Tax=Bombardia bombarda TaxID=252184 RepID=A0AA40CEH6_9PEZI|nr:hypothetical protein B0T17DRAFT_485940 [Bombardia bombarda]